MTTFCKTVVATICVGIGALTVPGAEAGEIPLRVGGGSSAVDTTSWQALKWQGVVRQRYDFSCGAAAVATVLTSFYDRPTGEREVFDDMFRRGDVERIKRQGFSLLDMRQFLRREGYQADGFRLTLEQLAAAGVPAIALKNWRGYLHFVVIAGITDREVLVADPARGMLRKPRKTFEQSLASDVFLAIRNQADTARANFNDEIAWANRPRPFFGPALAQQRLLDVTVLLPEPTEF
jgi:hypothetical protein